MEHTAAPNAARHYVEETRFGFWFLQSHVWQHHVLIDTWVIRWLFRHPMQVQKSAEEYLQMLRDQGFVFSERQVSYPYLWWSRANDFGLLERTGLRKPKPFGQREETLVNAVVRKPATAPC